MADNGRVSKKTDMDGINKTHVDANDGDNKAGKGESNMIKVTHMNEVEHIPVSETPKEKNETAWTEAIKEAEPEVRKEQVQTCGGVSQPVCDSTAMIGWGFLFGIGMCFTLMVAGSLHWSESAVCAFIKSADQEPQDYPLPRCFDTARFRNKTEIDTFQHYYWRLPKMTWHGQFSAWICYLLHQVCRVYTRSKWGFEFGTIVLCPIIQNLNLQIKNNFYLGTL